MYASVRATGTPRPVTLPKAKSTMFTKTKVAAGETSASTPSPPTQRSAPASMTGVAATIEPKEVAPEDLPPPEAAPEPIPEEPPKVDEPMPEEPPREESPIVFEPKFEELPKLNGPPPVVIIEPSIEEPAQINEPAAVEPPPQINEPAAVEPPTKASEPVPEDLPPVPEPDLGSNFPFPDANGDTVPPLYSKDFEIKALTTRIFDLQARLDALDIQLDCQTKASIALNEELEVLTPQYNKAKENLLLKDMQIAELMGQVANTTRTIQLQTAQLRAKDQEIQDKTATLAAFQSTLGIAHRAIVTITHSRGIVGDAQAAP